MQKKVGRGAHKRSAPVEKKVENRLDRPEPSKVIFAFIASIVLLLGFLAISNYTEVSVGKAYEIMFQGQEFAENMQINLLANSPEKLLLRVDGVVKKAQ